jgi:hypothetical protein
MELTEQTLSANETKNMYGTYRTLTPITDAHAYLQQETTTCITMFVPLLTSLAAGQKETRAYRERGTIMVQQELKTGRQNILLYPAKP